MILVTGGTGLVGSHLLYNLALSGNRITAIYRNKNRLKKVVQLFKTLTTDADALFNTIHWVDADITNIPQLEVAFKNVTQVYHCAALISFNPKDYKTLRQVNIKGTTNVVNLCISYGVEKLCYVSSVASLGTHKNPNKPITETTYFDNEADNNVYAITKYGAELEVWRGTQEGVSAVIVNPGVILGAGFWNAAGSGSIFKRVYKGLIFYTTGTTGFVDVKDVVSIMQQLMESTIKNESFIVVSENLSFKTLIQHIANELQVKVPKRKAPNLLLQIAWRCDTALNIVFNTKRRLTKHNVKSIQTISMYSNTKIKNALNFNFISVATSIKNYSMSFLKFIKR